jgi:hypothetical protein
LSTLALEGSSPVGATSRLAQALRYGDLVLLALALPVFVLADLPLLGYAVAAAAWLIARGLGLAADRRAARLLKAGERRAALGTVAAATLGRVWLVTLSVLLVGGLADREDGLAAAVLCVPVVTVYLAGNALARIMEGEPR